MRSLISTMVAALALCGGSAGVALGETGTLGPLKGKSRPIVVLSDSRADPRVAKQISALDGTKPELDKRDITIIKDDEPGSKLRKHLGVTERGFAVVLVGKDGSVKKVWHDYVEPAKIFTVIDSMPMRQQEMKG